MVRAQINRGRLIARQFSEVFYQTTLSECFPLYFSHKVPSYVMRECMHFHSATGLCWQPSRPAVTATLAHPASRDASLITSINEARRKEQSETAVNLDRQLALDQLLATTTASSAMLSEPTPSALFRMRQLVTIGVKVVTRLRNHVHFILHSVHRRSVTIQPGRRTLYGAFKSLQASRIRLPSSTFQRARCRRDCAAPAQLVHFVVNLHTQVPGSALDAGRR